MKSNIKLLVTALALSTTLHAQEYNTYDCDKGQWCCDIEELDVCEDYYFQVRGAAFLPLNTQFHKTYSSSIPTLQVEGAITLSNDLLTCNDSVLFWGNVSWSQEKGKSRKWSDHTKLNLIPYSFGLEYQYPLLCNCDVYLGVGPSYSVLRLKNSDCFETKHSKRYHWGVMTKTGLRYSVWQNVFVDVFADYYYTKFGKVRGESVERIDVNIRGFFVGGGLGFRW